VVSLFESSETVNVPSVVNTGTPSPFVDSSISLFVVSSSSELE
jgi:hypothetical protein